MKKTWHYYRTQQGFGPGLPKVTCLDIKESAAQHYSFVFKTIKDEIKVDATWEYFDAHETFFIPARIDAHLEDVTTIGNWYNDKVISWLRDAGITEDNFSEFLEAGFQILNR